MQKHIKVYFDYFDLTIADFIACEYCKKQANDIHHLIFRSQLGKDTIENLMALCRDCHTKAHKDKEFNEQLKQIHETYIKH